MYVVCLRESHTYIRLYAFHFLFICAVTCLRLRKKNMLLLLWTFKVLFSLCYLPPLLDQSVCGFRLGQPDTVSFSASNWHQVHVPVKSWWLLRNHPQAVTEDIAQLACTTTCCASEEEETDCEASCWRVTEKHTCTLSTYAKNDRCLCITSASGNNRGGSY